MLDLEFAITSPVVDALMEVSRHDAVCNSFPLARHLRRRLEEQGDLRWVQAVSTRESLSWSGHDIVQALRHDRPPVRSKESESVVRGIAGLVADVRRVSSYPGAAGPGALGKFHRRFDADSSFRTTPRNIWFVGGVPEIVERAKISDHIDGLGEWLAGSPLGHSPVIGVALAHQEFMRLNPFHSRGIATVDALTRCLLMQRHVNDSGIGFPEHHFVRDAERHADAIRDRSPGGRQRWAQDFVKALLDAMLDAWMDVEHVRDHVEREPWLDARPLTEREQTVYDFILRKRKATSAEVTKALGDKAFNLRRVQRDLVRLGELGLIQKVGARKDAWYQPMGIKPDPDSEPVPVDLPPIHGARRK